MNNRTSINLLRQAGVVLIAFPEPVTTGLGFACVAAAQYMANAQKRAQRELIRKKKHNRFPEDFIYPHEVDNNSYTTKKLNFYSYDKGKRYGIPSCYQYNHQTMAKKAASYVKPEKSQPTVKIQPDLQRLARIRAEEMLKSRENPNSHTEQKVTLHKINLDALFKRYQNLNQPSSADVVPCKVNMTLLQQDRDSEKRQIENASVRAPKIQLRPRNIDAETLIKRYRKLPFSSAAPA
jgi:hypothetical protein